MKNNLLLLVFLMVITCSFCQKLVNSRTDDTGDFILLGQVNQDVFEMKQMSWFEEYYEAYHVNDAMVSKIKDSLLNYTITVFFGSWCGDSKRNLPAFIKVLNSADFPSSQLKMIAVDYSKDAYKKSPTREELGLNIHRVPTFIFYKNGIEINRIVESPKKDFERDINDIITHNYTSNYKAVSLLHNQLNQHTIDSLIKKDKKFIRDFSEILNGSKELNTYGYKLLRSEAPKKACYVFELNSKIFPYQPKVYNSLANAYFTIKSYHKALINCYKVLQIDPNNKRALEMIEHIKTLKNTPYEN